MEKSFTSEMPPPPVPKPRKLGKNLGQSESASTSMTSDSDRPTGESEGLFVTQDDDYWDPPNYEDNGESLGWNATENNVWSANSPE